MRCGGTDVKDIKCVVNFDFPAAPEEYVHRIGRTGRAGASGTSYTFFTEANAKHASALLGILRGAKQHVPPSLARLTTVLQ